MYFDNIKAKASEIYGPFADYSSSSQMLKIYGRAGSDDVGVTLIVNKREDNSLFYLMQHTTDETGEYSFTLKAPENLEEYIIYVRCGSELYEVTPYIN